MPIQEQRVLSQPGPHFPCQGLWWLSSALMKPRPPASATPCPQLPTPTQGPELRLRPAPPKDFPARKRQRVEVRPCPRLCHWCGLRLAHLQPRWHAGPPQLWGPPKEGESRSRAPPWQEKAASRWPGPARPCGCFGCSPVLVLSPWPPLLKCHFLSGLQWVYLRGPFPCSALFHPRKAQGFAAQNSFISDPHHRRVSK